MDRLRLPTLLAIIAATATLAGCHQSPAATTSSKAPETPALLPGYIGADENSIDFLQLQPTGGGRYTGTWSQQVFDLTQPGFANPKTSSGSTSANAVVSGSAITITLGGQSASGTVTDAGIELGLTDDVAGFHEIKLSPGTSRDYSTMLGNYVPRWNAWADDPAGQSAPALPLAS